MKPSRSMSAVVIALLIVWWPLQGVSSAAESMKIKVERATADSVLTGQRVTLNVTLYTPTLFASAPVFELPQVPGVLLMHVEGSPVLGTEQVGDDSYTTQLHQLALFCIKPGKHTVPSFAVRVDSPPTFGAAAEEHRLTTDAFTIEAKMPPGTENLPGILCTKKLDVKEEWFPESKKSATVGDSVTRRITLVTPDVPAMAMPPIGLAKVEGVEAYPKPPAVLDHSERGTFTGERTDSCVYVFSRPGSMEFPAIEIPWWDLENNKLARVSLPAMTVDVAARDSKNVATSPANVPASRRMDPQILLRLAVAVVLLAAVAYYLWKRRNQLTVAIESMHQRHAESEEGRFAHLHKLCRAGDAAATYNALVDWLEAFQDGDPVVTFERNLPGYSTDPALRREVDTLQDAALGGRRDWSPERLWDALSKARRLRHIPAVTGKEYLPPLNPTSALDR